MIGNNNNDCFTFTSASSAMQVQQSHAQRTSDLSPPLEASSINVHRSRDEGIRIVNGSPSADRAGTFQGNLMRDSLHRYILNLQPYQVGHRARAGLPDDSSYPDNDESRVGRHPQQLRQSNAFSALRLPRDERFHARNWSARNRGTMTEIRSRLRHGQRRNSRQYRHLQQQQQQQQQRRRQRQRQRCGSSACLIGIIDNALSVIADDTPEIAVDGC